MHLDGFDTSLASSLLLIAYFLGMGSKCSGGGYSDAYSCKQVPIKPSEEICFVVCFDCQTQEFNR